jgi:hypothetical protein
LLTLSSFLSILQAAYAAEENKEKIDWSQPEYQGVVGMFRRARKIANMELTSRAKNAFKYGPPYLDDYGGSIIDECNKAHPSMLEVHQMLIDGANPNLCDVEDKWNTPLHYVSR